jgi:hypothetical protein
MDGQLAAAISLDHDDLQEVPGTVRPDVEDTPRPLFVAIILDLA